VSFADTGGDIIVSNLRHYEAFILAAVSLQGDAKNLVGDAALITELEKTKGESNGKDSQIELLTQRVHDLELQIQRLEANLKDKDVIIELLKERRK